MMNEVTLIKELCELDSRLFTSLDLNFASFVCRCAGAADSYPLFLAAALTANASVIGKHSCLELNDLHTDLNSYFEEVSDLSSEDDTIKESLRKFSIPDNWSDILLGYNKAVTLPSEKQNRLTPLVLDGTSLYIYRDWLCEQALAKFFKERSAVEPQLTDHSLLANIASVSDYFKPMENELDWQQVAVFAALRRKFTVISGGPGTGKTTVAAAICAMLLESEADTKITLCAPTGKAQARLQESILSQIESMNCSDSTKESLKNTPIATIHRLLGSRPGTPSFRHNAKHQLVLDVLIVDEASMISQSLMKALLEALPESARLIMLGDMQQLASVEAGMVLKDFCVAAQSNSFSSSFVSDFEKSYPAAKGLLTLANDDDNIFNGAVIELKENHRFASDRGIGLCAKAIRELPEIPVLSEAEMILKAMQNDDSGEVAVEELPLWTKNQFARKLELYLKKLDVEYSECLTRYLDFLKADSVEDAYRLLNQFRILCVHRGGLYGVETVNRLIENMLCENITYKKQIFYKGKPIIINENNYAMELFNGDTGIIWPDADGDLKAFFPSASGESTFRAYDLKLLPSFSPAYAITVHKSQGSGFQRVLVITPPETTPLMTREMLYTALSRAEKCVVFWTKEQVLLAALQSVTKRYSNLRANLLKK